MVIRFYRPDTILHDVSINCNDTKSLLLIHSYISILSGFSGSFMHIDDTNRLY
nr:MAG TPA: hypothetical protein [Caudoviricetes sp.]